MKKITALLTAGVMLVTMAYGSENPLPKSTRKYFSFHPKTSVEDYLAKTVILKVKPQFRAWCQVNSINNSFELNVLLSQLGATSVTKMFPFHKAPEREKNDMGLKYADISIVYTVTYVNEIGVEDAINWLAGTGLFEYVEPYYIPKVTFTPNDPQFGSQPHLGTTRIDAVNGWNIHQGSTSITVGITDTGTELTHPDLQNNIQYNTADPIDGVDNDGDNYTDNYRGWDLGMNDNDPTWQSNQHGVHVSGCSSASTNNSTGVAGSGFLCRFLPVKIANSTGALIAGYQGIVYAADHGCRIINCSWGRQGGASSFEQSIIDYATINKNALVVVAAGNNNLDEEFWPASYNYAFSVAATNSINDIKASFSNYNYTVDVSAPGNNILATWNGGTYVQQSGTSMASPVCAGVCAIVASYFPTLNALQVGERVKATSTYIDGIVQNATYANKIGRGRVDMFDALNTANPTSVVFTNRAVTDNNDDIFINADTLRITGDFINYLAATTSATTATLAVVVGGTYCNILNGTVPLGAMGTLQTVNNNSNPFRVKIQNNPPLNTNITFRVTITDGAYSQAYFFVVSINTDYINITVNDVLTTITSKGRIGYNLDGQQQGLGFKYNSNDLMYESSFIVGTSNTKVSDMFRGAAAVGDVDNASLLRVYQVVPSVFSDFDVDGKFNDAVAPSPIGIETHHKAFAWTQTGSRKYVIVEYTMKNTTVSTVSNLYAGVITDWDVMNYSMNKADFNAGLKMGYIWSTETNGLYVGTKLLTSTAPVVHYAIDNVTGGGGGVDATAGTPEFDTGEKYLVLSTNRQQAGNTQVSGNDVMNCVSSGPFTILPGDSVKVAFALLAGDDLTDLNASALDAQNNYNGSPSGTVLLNESQQLSLGLYPNPATEELYLNMNLPADGNADLKIFNLLGQEITTVTSQEYAAGKHYLKINVADLATGIYTIKLTCGEESVTRKVVISR